MKLRQLTPMLWTSELEATVRFYTDVLGFETDEYNKEWGWCHLHRDDVNIMFSVPNEHSNYPGKPSFTGSLYIYTESVDEWWDALRTKASIGYELENFAHGMREFAILDNNGYMLQFGRELRENEMPG